MHLNTRSMIVFLLLAICVSAFGCVEPAEETEELATIPQEIVLFSAKHDVSDTALSLGYSKIDGWKVQRYADVQNATVFHQDGDLQTRQQEVSFSGSTARGRFSGSLATGPRGDASLAGSQRGFDGSTYASHNFYGSIAGGPAGTCSLYLLCDFVEVICDMFAGMAGSSNIGECREAVSECRGAIDELSRSHPREAAEFCAMYDSLLSGSFDFDNSGDNNSQFSFD